MNKTSVNDVTGHKIKTGKGDGEKFASGWDAIWGKPKEEDTQEVESPPPEASSP